MTIYQTFKTIFTHPLNEGKPLTTLAAYLKWQVGSRLIPGEVLYHWVNDVKVIVANGDTGFTQNIYCGLQDFSEMSFVLHYLHAEDTFIDIGSNIGSYSILSLACGCEDIYCFEPVPDTYSHLINNIQINNAKEIVHSFNLGLSDKEGELKFTINTNTKNHVADESTPQNDISTVKVNKLDDLVKIEKPTIIKIDVEGYELNVLKGAKTILKSPNILGIIMEVNGSGLRYGVSDEELLLFIKNEGYLPYIYDPYNNSFSETNEKLSNYIFIKDLDSIIKRRDLIIHRKWKRFEI